MPTILQLSTHQHSQNLVAINGRIVRRKILILRRKYGKLHYISYYEVFYNELQRPTRNKK